MSLERLLPTLLLALGAISLSLLLSGEAFAHVALKSSSPGNGATVSAPKTLDLGFDHPAKLTKLTLTGGGKEIPVSVDSAAPAAKDFIIPLPALAPGEYRVRWAALGSDGHAMTGSFSFRITGN